MKQLGYTLIEMCIALFFPFVIVGGGIGWILNIVKLVGMSMDPLTGMLIARACGIFFFPLGMVLGYL